MAKEPGPWLKGITFSILWTIGGGLVWVTSYAVMVKTTSAEHGRRISELEQAREKDRQDAAALREHDRNALAAIREDVAVTRTRVEEMSKKLDKLR